jgi:hypothetical protein
MLMIDLFTGRGGASQAMKERGWLVVTLDNEAKFQPEICRDITGWSWVHDTPGTSYVGYTIEGSGGALESSAGCTSLMRFSRSSLVIPYPFIIDDMVSGFTRQARSPFFIV